MPLLPQPRAAAVTDAAYSLAKIRVLGVIHSPDNRAKSDSLRTAADHAGRRLVDVVCPGGERGIALGWQNGDEPAVMDEPLSEIYRHATTTVQLMLAACLRCCWPDPGQPLYPGEATTETVVFRALDNLRARAPSADSDEVRKGAHGHRRSALRVLRACGFLAPDAGEGTIRLGPAIAQWTPADITELASDHHLLPSQEEPA